MAAVRASSDASASRALRRACTRSRSAMISAVHCPTQRAYNALASCPTDMLARLQRCWVVLLLLTAAAIDWWLIHSGVSPWLAALLAVIVLNVHACVLAFEFAWLGRSRPGATLPRPAPRALIGAWWGEVLTG